MKWKGVERKKDTWNELWSMESNRLTFIIIYGCVVLALLANFVFPTVCRYQLQNLQNSSLYETQHETLLVVSPRSLHMNIENIVCAQSLLKREFLDNSH